MSRIAFVSWVQSCNVVDKSNKNHWNSTFNTYVRSIYIGGWIELIERMTNDHGWRKENWTTLRESETEDVAEISSEIW